MLCATGLVYKREYSARTGWTCTAVQTSAWPPNLTLRTNHLLLCPFFFPQFICQKQNNSSFEELYRRAWVAVSYVPTRSSAVVDSQVLNTTKQATRKSALPVNVSAIWFLSVKSLSKIISKCHHNRKLTFDCSSVCSCSLSECIRHTCAHAARIGQLLTSVNRTTPALSRTNARLVACSTSWCTGQVTCLCWCVG